MIGGTLEYVISSLPDLHFRATEEERRKVSSLFQKYAGASEEGKSIPELLDQEASKFLSDQASGFFRTITLDNIHEKPFQQSRNKVLSAFSRYMFALKMDLQDLRIARKNNEGANQIKLPNIPLTPGTPLEEEVQLLNLQWDKLEELSLGHYSDFEALVIYKLKVLLLQRWWSFDQEKGFENFLKITKKD